MNSTIQNFYTLNKQHFDQHYAGINVQQLERLILDEIHLRGIPKQSEEAKKFLIETLEECLSGRPLEYILGHAYFYNGFFQVNESVLIPRFETEYLVVWAQKQLRKLKSLSSPPCLVDVGTGSGNILLALLRELDFPVRGFGLDISNMALEVFERNIFDHRYAIHHQTTITPLLSDRLEKFEGEIDLLITNPPYIKRESDKGEVHSSALRFEPHTALFLADDTYDEWFQVFFSQARARLSAQGMFIMEGHENHLEDLANLASQFGFDTKVSLDLSQRPRYLEGIKNG